MALTTYQVLARVEDDGRKLWQECGEYEGHSNEQACRRAAEKDYSDGGTEKGVYVAVPIRSFERYQLHVDPNPRAQITALVS